MTFTDKITNYFREAKTELKKVVWPSKKETIKHTALVIGISVSMGVFFAILDFVFSRGLEKIITR
ncbi:MAG: preprotein translocase subunit SecE [bacterium]|nr:preprotein translocase subunit SecE [bacterium]